MSRRTGSFPTYTKLDLSPEKWPKQYWDSCLQCQRCGFRWPNEEHFNVSPCCIANVNLINESPEIRWPNALTELLRANFEMFYNQWNDGLEDEELCHETVKGEIPSVAIT